MCACSYPMQVAPDLTRSHHNQASRFDSDDEDEMTAFMKHKAQKAVDEAKDLKNVSGRLPGLRDSVHCVDSTGTSTVTLKYDKYNNPIVEKTEIEPLKPIDHSKMSYARFKKDFYREAPAIAAMTSAQVRRGDCVHRQPCAHTSTPGCRYTSFEPHCPFAFKASMWQSLSVSSRRRAWMQRSCAQ